MSFTAIPREGAVVVRIDADRLDITNAPQLKHELKKLLESGVNTLIVEFAAVKFVDSSGLGVLLSALRVAARTGSDVRVVGLRPEVLTIFELAQMHRVLDIYPTEREALAS